MQNETMINLDPITKLTKDLREASKTLSDEEARFLVDYYYMMQHDRIRANNQIRSMQKTRVENEQEPEPHGVLVWLGANTALLELQIKNALHSYAETFPAGQWALSQHGIGPVITAGLLAHVDIEKAKSPSAIWRFAGLDPTTKWGKKEKRPWNARLKVICWHIGECFKRTSGSDKSFYGPLYQQRKTLEVERNEAGQFAEQAKAALEEKKYKKETTARACYEQGKLPPGRLDLRATRYATKLFLSHYWVVLFESTYLKRAPEPWIIQHGGHVDLIEPPGWKRQSA
jgi:hypothetical protein